MDKVIDCFAIKLSIIVIWHGVQFKHCNITPSDLLCAVDKACYFIFNMLIDLVGLAKFVKTLPVIF